MTTWPENVRCHPNAAFEPIYRRLLETAAGFLELIAKEERELPVFSAGHTASPKNQTAEEMWNQLEAALSVASSDAQLTNIERVKAFTFAVRGAYVIRGGGFGEAGWERFLATIPAIKRDLSKMRPATPAPRRPEPTPTARPAGESMTVGEGDVADVSARDLQPQ
jgi:hypothetical protein